MTPEFERVRQVFRFLKAFAERRVPVRRNISEHPWRLFLSELPRFPTIEVDLVVGHSETVDLAGDNGEDDGAPLLRVRRPELTPPPEPPEELEEWLLSGWDDPDHEPEVRESRNVSRDGRTVTEVFAQDAHLQVEFADFFDEWWEWSDAEKPARQAMKVFEALYELRGRIELDSEGLELMLGDGRLRVRAPSGTTDHPVLLQRVELQFNPDVPELLVLDTDRPPELFVSAIQHEGSAITPEGVQKLRSELEEGVLHPLGGDATTEFLRRVVQQLSAKGRMCQAEELPPPGPEPVIARDPVLFLRHRVSGFPAAFERVLEDLETHPSDLPPSLKRLVGVDPPVVDEEDVHAHSPWGEPDDVLLTKAANAEQIRSARALSKHRAVLVQGPPGTGKSHTIANLIGHLVADGKRVLVTSHATKALRVLRGPAGADTTSALRFCA
jgi:hypothetical protein